MSNLLPKSHKYWKRDVNDALHPSKLTPKLMPGKGFHEQLEAVEKYFNPASTRMGGSLSFSMIDRKTSNQMYDQYLERNKKPIKQVAPKVNPNEFIGKPTEQPQIRICTLPSNYCPDCDSAIKGAAIFPPYKYVGKDGKMTEQGSTLNLSPVIEAWPSLGVRPGDVIRHIVCGECAYKAEHNTSSLDAMVQDPATGIWDKVPVTMLLTLQRYKRIEEHIEAFMLHAHSVQKEKTFYDEQGEDMANA